MDDPLGKLIEDLDPEFWIIELVSFNGKSSDSAVDEIRNEVLKQSSLRPSLRNL